MERINQKTRIFASPSKGPPKGYLNRFLNYSDKFVFTTLFHVSQPDFLKFLRLPSDPHKQDILMSEFVLSALLGTLSKFIKHSSKFQ